MPVLWAFDPSPGGCLYLRHGWYGISNASQFPGGLFAHLLWKQEHLLFCGVDDGFCPDFAGSKTKLVSNIVTKKERIREWMRSFLLAKALFFQHQRDCECMCGVVIIPLKIALIFLQRLADAFKSETMCGGILFGGKERTVGLEWW